MESHIRMITDAVMCKLRVRQQAPPAVLREIGARYGVSGEAVGQRIQRVAAAGVRLPLPADLEHEVSRPSRPGEDHLLRTRWALLLGRPGPQRDDRS